MTKRSDAVKRWRQKTKQKMVDAFGGKCGICGYNKCLKSLDFHHLNPQEKEFSLSFLLRNPLAWTKIVHELKKCICVCSNCHGEIHEKLITIPDDISRYNETLIENYNKLDGFNNCPICGKYKPSYYTTCSKKCSASLSRSVDWEQIDLKTLIQIKTLSEIAEKLNISDGAVSKRMKKLNLTLPKRGKVNWEKVDLIELKKTMSNVTIAKMLNISETAVRKRLKKIGYKNNMPV